MHRLAIAIALLAVSAPTAHARSGDLDRSFAYGGRIAQKVWGSGGGNVCSRSSMAAAR